KDMDGKAVSFEEYKGKIVILDFWATWCGPCKKSFPAMQAAVKKYKTDPNVKFFFIDTWEADANYEEKIKQYMSSNKYDFHVLLDNKQTNVSGNFNIDGLPTKFVIDGNGIIRFKLLGFEGGDDAAVEEISAMIDIAKKSSQMDKF
ncbi:MAG TPA: TlpA disulfide reductase family protein, partial [Pedobacter sp.]